MLTTSGAHGDDLVDRLRLARTRRIGPVTYAQLLRRFGSARAALDALPDLIRRNGGTPPAATPREAIEREIERTHALGGGYVMAGDGDYPPLLAELNNAPVALIARGNRALMRRPAVAIVGARNASAAAVRFGRMLASQLSEAGQVIVSGLARGIDTAAHMGAMAGGGSRGGCTIGVIASGIDISFPPENARLQEEIADQHLLLTEYPPGTEPIARQFPHRNRIIAGLAAGTVVVEAAPKSGSLLTARMAAEAGRDVMAVPGSPLDPRAQGCNSLIREGATLIQNADDVLEAVRSIDARMVRQVGEAYVHQGRAHSADDDPDDSQRRLLFGLLGPVAVSVDELIRQSALAQHLVQTMLMELEIAGRIERHAGGRVSLKF